MDGALMYEAWYRLYGNKKGEDDKYPVINEIPLGMFTISIGEDLKEAVETELGPIPEGYTLDYTLRQG